MFVRAPDSVAIGREWSDSGTYVTCRDGVRIDVMSRRRFRITAYERRDSSSVLIASRTGTITLRGLAVRGDDTTRVDGSGSNSMWYELDATTGHVVAAAGTGSLDLTVRGARKSQRAHQTSALQISIRAP